MASPINTSKLTGSSLDVASIVSQLMEVERKPLDTLVSKIDRSEVKISALGSFQSKLSALQDAVSQLQTPANFKTYTVSSSNSATVSAEPATNVAPGLYTVAVDQLATNAVINFLQPTYDALPTSLDFRIGSGGLATTVTLDLPDQVANPAANPEDYFKAVRDAFNDDAALKDRFVARLVQYGADSWGLSIQGLSTGVQNNIDFLGGRDAQGDSLELDGAHNGRQAMDARFTINSVDYIRSNNSVDVLGLQLSLADEGEANIEVRQSTIGGMEAVQGLATAYNELLVQYKALTSSSSDTNQRGVFNSDFSLASIMRQINTQLLGRISYGSNSSLSGLGALGLEFADNGQLVYKPALIADSTQLETALGQGLYLGQSSSNNLSTQLAETLRFGGLLYERIQSEKTLQSDLSKRKASVEEKMIRIEERYTAQYAALDSLLFRLNSTNTALKSALDALAAQNKSD